MTTPSRRRGIPRAGTPHNRRRASMPTPRMVAIVSDGELQVHAKGALYASLCGLDGNDSAIGQAPAALPPNAKIDCPQCRELWSAWSKFTAKDFA